MYKKNLFLVINLNIYSNRKAFLVIDYALKTNYGNIFKYLFLE